MGTWGSVFKPAQCKNRKEWNRIDKHSHLFPSNPKIPFRPKIPSFADTPKCPAWRNPLALGYGAAWNHHQMENFLHPTLTFRPGGTCAPTQVLYKRVTSWSFFVVVHLPVVDILLLPLIDIATNKIL